MILGILVHVYLCNRSISLLGWGPFELWANLPGLWIVGWRWIWNSY